MSKAKTLKEAINDFLKELQLANRSTHTVRAYRTDLNQLTVFYNGETANLDTDTLRDFFTQHTTLSPATRARKQAAVASFITWAYHNRLIDHNPMERITRVQPEAPSPCAISRETFNTVLAHIPAARLRDRLLFTLLFETGMRIGEALSLYVEDLDLTPDDEHVTLIGKGKKRRTILLDDTKLVLLLRRYLHDRDYQHGPLFRAHKNGHGGPLRYQSAQELWTKYCHWADVDCSLHQLRHAHATELINDGVSLATIRKRLGHKNLQTTLRYAEQSNSVADQEVRNWRRYKNRQ